MDCLFSQNERPTRRVVGGRTRTCKRRTRSRTNEPRRTDAKRGVISSLLRRVRPSEIKHGKKMAKVSKRATDRDGGQIFLKPKPRCRKFIFKPFKRLESGELAHDDTKEAVHVTIPEQLAASYGLYIWPCAPVLAWYVWLHQDQFEVFRQHSCLNLKMPKQISR